VALTIREIRDNCIKARESMQRARDGKYAVGAFNIDNQETLIAICKAAQKLQAPVMVEVSDGEVKAMGLDNVRDMVNNYKRQFEIEMYINLDHSPSVEDAKAGIDAGFEFIHIDVSQANHDATDEEIINATKEVVDYAKFTGALVESEPHYFGGSSNVHKEAFDYEDIKKTFSTPKGTKAFVDATGIDTFAAAVGNLHGSYPVPKVLDIELLERIKKSIDCNISLHGGSGTPGHFFEEAVRIGVTKINVNSDMRRAFRDTLEKVLRDNPDEYAVGKLMPEVYGAVQAVVESKLASYNSAGKARP
jgi:fructose-bisphosphate aldolase, class II